MNDIEKLASFIEVVRTRNANKAAKKLGYKSPNSVMRNITYIEKELGQNLIHKENVQSITLTINGKNLYDDIITSYQQKENLNAKISEHLKYRAKHLKNNIFIKILTTTGAMSQIVVHRLKKLFLSDNNIKLVLSTTHNLDEIEQKDFDIAILPEMKHFDKIHSKKIFTLHNKLYASKEYLHRKGIPKDVDDLAKHDLLSFDTGNSNWGDIDFDWHLKGNPSRHTIELAAAQIQACCDGYGIIAFPEEYPNIKKILVNIFPNMVDKKDVYFYTQLPYNKDDIYSQVFSLLKKF